MLNYRPTCFQFDYIEIHTYYLIFKITATANYKRCKDKSNVMNNNNGIYNIFNTLLLIYCVEKKSLLSIYGIRQCNYKYTIMINESVNIFIDSGRKRI